MTAMKLKLIGCWQITLAKAWKPASVKREQRATSSVANLGQCCDSEERLASDK